MPLEIERKFLVTGESWRAQASRSRHMAQGYLLSGAEKASVRVRLDESGARLNIKAAVIGRARAEYEYSIPAKEGREIFQNLCVGRLEKTRHYLERDGLTWEVDEFHGGNAGLIVAEIELSFEAQEFSRPDWLGEEVTQERRYYNHQLALHPYRTWNVS